MQPILEATGITKQFPGTLALNDVHLDLLPGEIHAVIGENGAGKSTLMKILAGVVVPDQGTILFEGNSIELSSPQEALQRGIVTVYQELSLIPTLTVAENIFPGRLPTNRWGMVRYGELYRLAQTVLQQLHIEIDPRTPLETLSIAQQQLVEIAKALSLNCKVLILDEPTSALTDHEATMLLAFLRRLAADGVGILYISHKLNEIFTIAHRVTILRDGKYVATKSITEVTPDDVIRMMVGRELGNIYPPKAQERGAALFEIRNFSLANAAPSNSFQLFRGEVLGFAGLVGAGRSELLRAVFGAEPKASGEIYLHGKAVTINNPRQAIELGIGYLPEDRKNAGLFLEMSIKLNVEATVIESVGSNGMVIAAKERTLAEQYVEQLNISTPHIEQEIRRLSGGNQQKTLLAKWLAINPKILIVDEPTRGIDVGAKKEIHYLLRQLAEQGVGVIIISSELPEVLGMSDRILVMRASAIVGEFDGAEATEELIIRAASRHESE